MYYEAFEKTCLDLQYNYLIQKRIYIYIYLSFFIYLVKHLVTIFCNQTFIFNIPFSTLNFVVWYIVISSITANVPQNTIIRLSCIIAVIKSQYMCTLMFIRYFTMFDIQDVRF